MQNLINKLVEAGLPRNVIVDEGDMLFVDFRDMPAEGVNVDLDRVVKLHVLDVADKGYLLA